MPDKTNHKPNLLLPLLIAIIVCPLFAQQTLPKSWERAGPLGPKPNHTTDAYPLSDQANKAGWVKYAQMSDEFDGDELDAEKWWPKNPRWLGRKPAWFDPANVNVADGKLHLSMKKNEPPGMPKDKGYHTYTSAAVQSKGLVKYGYFEVRCRPMASAGSSSFWFYNNTPDLWTEIDVFEIGGRAPKFEKKYNMNVHVFKTPTENKHWSKHGEWFAPTNLADDYHTYALEWDAERIKWYFDGVLVRWVENTHWHQPLTLNFDSETMPDWFGLPKDEDLPSTYSIEYVRAWKTHNQILTSGPLILKMFGAKGKNAATANHTVTYKRIFTRMDRDGDKKISQADYVENSPYMTKEARKHIFAASDSNADGILTEQEYIDNRAITDEAKAIYEKMNDNQDGALTKQEFLANTTIKDKILARKIFQKLDTNQNDELNIPEYLRTWGKWARQPAFP
ncbi:MAG: family 16 glycosylhydrolase [Phycisphaerae bacterium]|nr:family 16 glycosylhydrolase [Phycisphaerae bacterium]